MRIPKLGRHKGSGQGYGTFDGRERYFGVWPARLKTPPADVRAAYEAFVAEWLRGRVEPRPAPVKGATVAELWERYLAHAEGYYRKRGKVTSEVGAIKTACRVAARLHADLRASAYDAARLREVQDEFVRLGWCRTSVNEQVGRVRRMFRWGAQERMLPAAVLAELGLLAPLKRGRCTAGETAPVRPVAWELVEKTLPHLPPVVAAMVRVHYLLGCRSEDIVGMRAGDLDRSGPVWLFRPDSWKGEHQRGPDDPGRLVYWVGPRAQAILAPLLEPPGYVFPTRRKPHGCYSTGSYRYLVTRTCAAHGLERWVPLQLRHARLTEVRKGYGVEAAQTVAMHRTPDVTLIYAEANLAKSREIMAEIG